MIRALALAAVVLMSMPGWGHAGTAASGCGQAPPPAPPTELIVHGTRRELVAAIPDRYDPSHPYRLILAFHGRTTPAEKARRYFGLEEADADRSIIVYPKALHQADGTYIWRQPEDFALFDAIVDRYARTYCIAPDKVFAVGHSLGATFANDLACARGGTLRAVATVAGGLLPLECSGSVAALLLHNPKDRLVPIELGRAVRDRLLTQNGLPAKPSAIFPKAFNCRRYGPSSARNPVVWCPHHRDRTRGDRYYPHQWPQDVGAFIIKFFGALP